MFEESPSTPNSATNDSQPDIKAQLPEGLNGLNLTVEDRTRLAELNTIKLDAEDIEVLAKHFDAKHQFMVPYKVYKMGAAHTLRFFRNKYAASRQGEYGAIREAMGFTAQRASHWIATLEQVKIHGEQHTDAFCGNLTDDDLTQLDERTGVDHQAEKVQSEIENHRKKVESAEKHTSTDSATFKATKLKPEDVEKVKEQKSLHEYEFKEAVNCFARAMATEGARKMLSAMRNILLQQAEMAVEENA